MTPDLQTKLSAALDREYESLATPAEQADFLYHLRRASELLKEMLEQLNRVPLEDIFDPSRGFKSLADEMLDTLRTEVLSPFLDPHRPKQASAAEEAATPSPAIH